MKGTTWYHLCDTLVNVAFHSFAHFFADFRDLRPTALAAHDVHDILVVLWSRASRTEVTQRNILDLFLPLMHIALW